MSSAKDPWEALVGDGSADDVSNDWPFDDTEPFVLSDDALADQPDGAWAFRRNHVFVVMSATGGAGATTVACAIALALAGAQARPTLIDIDFERGDTHERWDVPRDRTLADLTPVLHELSPAHLDLVGYAHPSGVALCMSPAAEGAADDWRAADIMAVIECAARRGAVVVDCGTAPARHIRAACVDGATVVVLAPATLRGARRAAQLVRRFGSDVHVVLNRPVGVRVELSARAFAAACGQPVALTLPKSERAAERCRSGAWHESRRGLTGQLASFVEMRAHVAP